MYSHHGPNAATATTLMEGARYQAIFDHVPVSIWEEDWSEVIARVSGIRGTGVADFEAYFSERPELVLELLRSVRIVDVNRETLRMFGARDKQDMLQSLETVFATPDTLPGFVQELVALGNRQPEFRTEMALRRVTGELIVVLLTMSFPADEAASSTVLVSLMDITERRRMEAALRESEMRLLVATEASRIGPWDWNLATNEVYVSPEWKRQIGYTDQELANAFEVWQSRLHPDDRDATVKAALASARDPAVPYSVEFRLQHRDGDYRWIHTQARVLLDDEGLPSRMVGCHVDITEQKQSAEALSRSAQQMRMALQAARMGVMNLNIETGALEVIHAGGPLSALPAADGPAELASLLEHVHRDDHVLLRECVEQARLDDRVHECEFRIVLPDSSIRHVFVLSQRIKDPSGEVHLVGVDVDITERRQLEEQLRQSQKMEAIGRLTGGIAHDFNNLLTAILGYAHLLADNRHAAGLGMDEVQEIIKAGESAAAMNRQLLAFSRKQVLQPTVVDLNEVVGSTAKLLERLIGEDVQLVVQTEPGLWPVFADRVQMQQVLLNLTINARDAMPAGGQLTMVTRNVAGDGDGSDTIAVDVRDTGLGMSVEIESRVFEPFFTTKELGRGTGLGLSTVYGIVTQTGGRIDVATQVGQGTTFTVYLPRTRATAAHAPSDFAPQQSSGGGTILVVDDDLQVRALAQRVLERGGYQVCCAAGVAEALVLAGQHQLGLVVSDIMLGDGTGLQLSAALNEKYPGMRVLFISGYADEYLAERGWADNEAFLGKPFTPRSLLAKVSEILGTSNTADG